MSDMEIIIRPPVKIDVDGDRCGDCQMYAGYKGQTPRYRCDVFDGEILKAEDLYLPILYRCQACLDAEKEAGQ